MAIKCPAENGSNGGHPGIEIVLGEGCLQISMQLNKNPSARGNVNEESTMKRLITFAVMLSIGTLPLVPARGATQKTEAASDDGRILWQFDSGG